MPGDASFALIGGCYTFSFEHSLNHDCLPFSFFLDIFSTVGTFQIYDMICSVGMPSKTYPLVFFILRLNLHFFNRLLDCP